MIYTTVQCDKCGGEVYFKKTPSVASLQRVLRKEGWSFGKYVSCPTCNPKNKTEVRK